MKTLKNRINLKIQIPKLSVQEEPQKSNQITKNSISQITDNIYISGYLIGTNISYLKNNNFTHVINCCEGSSITSPDLNNSIETLTQLYKRNNIFLFSICSSDSKKFIIFKK